MTMALSPDAPNESKTPTTLNSAWLILSRLAERRLVVRPVERLGHQRTEDHDVRAGLLLGLGEEGAGAQRLLLPGQIVVGGAGDRGGQVLRVPGSTR